MSTKVDETRMVGLLIAAWDELWEAELHREVAPSCCILATRSGIESLRALGVTAWPVATETTVFNRAAAELVAAGQADVEKWPPFAWSIHVGPQSPGKGFPGHVWIGTEHWLIDLSARQFHRPGLLRFDRALLLPNQLPNVFTEDDGTMLLVKPLRGGPPFRAARDWKENWRDVTPRLLSRITTREDGAS